METRLTIPSWEDIIFDNRNKDYGAYPLRKKYSQRVLLGSGATVALVALLLLMTELTGNGIEIVPPPVPDGPTIKLTTPPKFETEKKKTKIDRPPRRPETRRATTIQVVAHEVDTTIAIDMEADIVPDLPDEFWGDGEVGIPEGDDSGGIPVVEEPEGKVIDIAEVMPEYEGGLEAMYKFIKKEVRYPKSARNIRVEGMVYVKFVVNSDGSVSDVTVIRGIHRDCDAEAARVIKLLSKKWRPGSQNGKPVNVRMVLPIRFQLN